MVTRPDDLDAFGAHVASAGRSSTTLARALSRRGSDLVRPGGPSCRGDRHPRASRRPPSWRSSGCTVFRKATSGPSDHCDSPSEQVHALRKSCKEMRYLMEVFKPLCDPKAYKNVLADFKELQDVLGEFQDGEVQAAALREFAQEMVCRARSTRTPCWRWVSCPARFETRQRAARETLTEHHEIYLGSAASAHVDRLVRA